LNTLEYFSSTVDIKSFKKLGMVKASSLLDAVANNTTVDKKSKILCIGKNLTAMGFVELGYDVYEYDGLGYAKEIKESDITENSFDFIVAVDEYFTRFSNELAQLQAIDKLCRAARIGIFTTLKDYKNMHMNQRYFQDPFEVKQDDGDAIIIRKRDWHKDDKQRWTHRSWIIKNNELITLNTVECRTMYFKQLAKFSIDAGARNIQVEKKLMYKSLFSKEFEYIIYISF